MNKIDKQYLQLVQDILDYGVEKKDRTGTGTKSIFGYTIRHKMSDGFPLLTTKKMAWKTMVTELLWFLRGDTNIKYLVDNDCHIWDGDAYKNYVNKIKLQNNWEVTLRVMDINTIGQQELLSKEEFINKIKTDDEFAKKWGELGPIYGKQWRGWGRKNVTNYDLKDVKGSDQYKVVEAIKNGEDVTKYGVKIEYQNNSIDQITNLINDLKTNPDSRRLMVSAWNVGELDQMVLPPCHYGFQVYTRELSNKERVKLSWFILNPDREEKEVPEGWNIKKLTMDDKNIPTRAISLMWNQRSVDVGLGLPFNIASYGLLLEIIAKITNMVPDELIGNLGDTHLYLNHIEPIKEQFGREYTLEERLNMVSEEIQKEFSGGIVNLPNFPNTPVWSDGGKMSCLDDFGVPRRTREPYPLPKLIHMKTDEFYKSLSEDLSLLSHLDNKDFTLENYQSHPTIKLPLSN